MGHVTTPLRVAQWATGSIGQIALRHFLDNPAYQLVGVYVTSPDKVGADAGALAGLGTTTSVRATNALGELIASTPDCVHYAPLHADLGEICALLEAGINVVTPVGFVYPTPSTAASFARIEAAATAGQSSFHGTGIHPGFSGDLLPLIFARLHTRIDQVNVREVADLRRHPSRAMAEALGFGRPPDQALADPAPMIRTMESIFEQSMTMVVEGLGQRVERFTMDVDYAAARTDLHVRSGVIPAGTVGGMRFVWTAYARSQPLVVFRTFWKMDDDLDPDWGYGSVKYHLRIDGDPSLEATFAPGCHHPTGDEGYWGRVWTAMNGINAIPTVCAARPGVLTHLDMPLVRPPGLVRPRSATFGEPVGIHADEEASAT